MRLPPAVQTRRTVKQKVLVPLVVFQELVTLMYHCHVHVWGVAILVFHISPKNYPNLMYPIPASKGIQVKLSNTVEPYSHHGITNIPGLLCVQISTKYFVECVA